MLFVVGESVARDRQNAAAVYVRVYDAQFRFGDCEHDLDDSALDSGFDVPVVFVGGGTGPFVAGRDAEFAGADGGSWGGELVVVVGEVDEEGAAFAPFATLAFFFCEGDVFGRAPVVAAVSSPSGARVVGVDFFVKPVLLSSSASPEACV